MTRGTRFSELHEGVQEFRQRTPTLPGQVPVRLLGVGVGCRWSSSLGHSRQSHRGSSRPFTVWSLLQPAGPLPWPLALEVSAATSLPPSCDSPGEQAAGRKRGARPCSRSPLPVLGLRPMGSRAACPATPSLPSPEQCPPRQRPVGLVPGQRLAGEKRQALGAGRWPGGGQPTQALGHVQPSAASVNSFTGTWPRPFVQISSSID